MNLSRVYSFWKVYADIVECTGPATVLAGRLCTTCNRVFVNGRCFDCQPICFNFLLPYRPLREILRLQYVSKLDRRETQRYLEMFYM